MKTATYRYLTLLFLFFSFILVSSQNLGFSKETSKYLNKVSKSSKVDKDKFFYITSKTDTAFKNHILPSVITFVKGKKTAVIDSLKIPDNKEVNGLNSSCGLDDITNDVIEYNLKEEPNIDYSVLVLRNLENGRTFQFPADKTVSVMLYTRKMWIFAKQYINTLKRLKENFGIDYILISMDGQDLKDIPDIYANAFQTKMNIK